MQIARVDLENVKSYDQHSVTFTKGINAICGANGAGKSTLLEAIGFALFDALPYTQDQFVREGEKVATVTVHLQGSDERSYQVVRKCGSYTQYYVYDPEIDAKLADGKSETTEWLYEFFGVEETADLSALFQDAVGVPQGLLTAAFLDRPGNRKQTFNPLLRVDEYQKVWEALLGPRRHLESWIADQENAIAAYKAEVKALPGLQTKASDLEAGIKTDKKHLAELEVELENVADRRNALEQVREDLEALERRAARAEGNVKSIEGRLNEARASVKRAETAHQVVQATQAGHQAYLEAQHKLAELEIKRRERDALKETRQENVTDLQLARSKLEGLVTALAEIAQAEAEVERLHPQVQEQERLEKALENARLETERLANARKSLTQERKRLEELEQRLTEAQAGLRERVEVETEIEPLQHEVDELGKQANTLSAQQAARQAEAGQIKGQISRAREHLAQTERSLKREQQERTDLERRLSEVQDGLDERTRVEAQIETSKQDIQAAEDTCRELDALEARLRAELDQNHARIDVLEASEAAECPVCRKPLTPQHRAELLAEHQAQQDQLKAALDDACSRLKKAEGSRQQARKTLDNQEKRLRKLPRPSEKDELVSRVESQRGKVVEIEQAVAAAETELARSDASQKELQKALSELASQWDELEDRHREQQKILGGLKSRLQTLPRMEEVDALSRDVSKQQNVVAETARAVGVRSDAPENEQRLQTELDRLGDPRSSYRSAANTATKKKTVEKDVESTESQIESQENEIAALDEHLSVFIDLDAQLERERAREADHEPDYRRYVEHIREAEALTERAERVAALSAELGSAQSEYSQVSEERERAARQYDAEAHRSLVTRQRALSDQRATLNERLRQHRKQLAEAQADVERLENVQEELVAARAERDELLDVQSLLEYLRHVLRDAGPKITQALVELISLQAARLYGDIMADHSARLRWTDEYEILLTAGGRERTFKQLSGGEQMAAALSTRLALLREVSDIDLAFFDEPTANLDEARRDNLAEQILNVKGFSQLFVISHDDTFERDTDNVIRVVKEEGVSRVSLESAELVEA